LTWDSRRRYRPGPTRPAWPAAFCAAVRYAVRRRSRPGGQHRHVRCVGAAAGPALGVAPLVDQRASPLVDVQYDRAVHTHRGRRLDLVAGHGDHPATTTSRGCDQSVPPVAGGATSGWLARRLASWSSLGSR
jgi:hypothetical protein